MTIDVVVEAWRLELKGIMALPKHAVAMRLHGRDVSYVVIFISETVASLAA